jgi:hypothetical protein
MILLDLVVDYADKIRSKEIEIDKDILSSVIKIVESYGGGKIISVDNFRLEQNMNEHPIANGITYEANVIKGGDVRNEEKRIMLLFYIAAVHKDFTIDTIMESLDDIEQYINDFFFERKKEDFIKCLKLNPNLGEDIKLWVQLKD